MKTPYDLNENASRIVYVKPVAVADLPAEVQAQAGEAEIIYSVHDAGSGEQLAFVADRKLADLLAAENDYSAVTVH